MGCKPLDGANLRSDQRLRLVPENPLYFQHQVAQVKRLGQNLGLRRFAVGLQRYGGKAGDEHHLGGRADFGAALRQFDPVHLRHDDIRQQQIEMLRFQQRHGLGSPVNRNHLVPRIVQRPRQIGAQGFFVFGKENADHARFRICFTNVRPSPV